MGDEIIEKFEQEYKLQAGAAVPVVDTPSNGPAPKPHKTDDIGEIRSVREFIQWFLSWEFKHVLTWPFIYGMIFPLVFLDISMTIYQRVCFPIYGIQRVRRSDYFHVKRHKLGYLNIVEKLNCDFCGYGNGLIAFTREVFARTEQYWCPIKHAAKIKGAHERYESFMGYGETEGFQEKLDKLRGELS